MTGGRRLFLLIASIVVGAVAVQMPAGSIAKASKAEVPGDAEEPDAAIVITGVRDIVVQGRAIKCRPLANDPLNGIRDTSALDVPRHVALLPAATPTGQKPYAWTPNMEQITGPTYWQRVGIGIEDYVYRAAGDDKPMCVGGRTGIGMARFGGFRRIISAEKLHGRRLRFTAWVATARAQQVSFFLAAGTPWLSPDPRKTPVRSDKPAFTLVNGGNTNSARLGGNHGWRAVLLETGPIDGSADHVSYGFNLQGSGNVWVYAPKLEVIPDDPGNARPRDLILKMGDEDEVLD